MVGSKIVGSTWRWTARPACFCVTSNTCTSRWPTRRVSSLRLGQKCLINYEIRDDLRCGIPRVNPVVFRTRFCPFPANPNGADANVAGVCDASGRVFGLMPHPERHIDPTQHPFWTRRDEQPEFGDGFAMFRNAVEWFE